MSESLEEILFYFNFCSLEGNGFYHVVLVSAIQQSEPAVGASALLLPSLPPTREVSTGR